MGKSIYGGKVGGGAPQSAIGPLSAGLPRFKDSSLVLCTETTVLTEVRRIQNKKAAS